MVRPPVIAVALGGRREDGKPEHLLQHRAYFSAVSRAGGVPMGVPLLVDRDHLRVLYEVSDAVLLPGGPDVAPDHYGQTPDPACELFTDIEVDGVELQLLEWALADDSPVLGVCRGLQLLNVARGGTLWQDLALQHHGSVSHGSDGGARNVLSHGVALEPSSGLRHLLGVDRIEVNSLHHQGVRELGDGLGVAGRSDDGLIEAVEMPGKSFVVAVQSHPEELCGTAEWADRLFAAFVAAARSGSR